MKKICSAILIITLLLAFAPTALAADVSVFIDGAQVPTEPTLHIIRDGMMLYDVPGRYFLDVQPEILSGRVFVPLRTIAVFFGAEIRWESPNVFLSKGDADIMLTIGSKSIISNEAESTIEAAPYIKDGRTMVPLRFISEAFGSTVNFANREVRISTPALYIDGREVVSVQNFVRMTMGGILYENSATIVARKLYELLTENLGDEIDEPEHFSFIGHFADAANFYFGHRNISFMASEGPEGEVLRRFHVYGRTADSPEDLNIFETVGPDLGKWLIHDVTFDRWNQVVLDDFLFLLLDIYSIGTWKIIYDNVA